MLIPFGEYLPDLPDFQNPGTTLAKNVIPAGMSYRSFPGLTVYSNALTARCQGSFSAKDSSGSSNNFAGDATKLYKMASAAYANVSKSGGYSTPSDGMWSWTKFGEKIIATNYNDNIQSYVLNSSTVFADLSASAPKARYLTTMRDFVVAANTNDTSDGAVPHRLRWCALNDATDWNVSPVTQSDFNDLDPTSGWINQIIGGEYGVIFQERAITRMEYVGSPVVWQFNEVERGKGTPAPNSAIKIGNVIYYLGIDGFYVFDGSQSIPIGENKINKSFFAELDTNYYNRITTMVDFSKEVIYWAYPASGNTNGRSNRILAFNYAPNSKNRWTFADAFDVELICNSFAEGYTLDGLDAITTNLENLPYSLDSRVWTGNNQLLSAFDSSHKLNNFTASAIAGTIESTEVQLYPNNRADIAAVRPMIDGGSSTVQVGTRNTQSDTPTFSSAVSTNSAGECPVRSNSRYHRFRVVTAGNFTDAIGIEVVDAVKAGKR